MKKILMMAAALSLLAGPAAMAQHRHGGGGGGGHHAAAARGGGGGGRHFGGGGRSVQARSFARRGGGAYRARPAGRSRAYAGRSYGGRAYRAHGYQNRAYANRSYGNRSYARRGYNARAYNRGFHQARGFHGYGRNHWRHASYVGSWRRGYRLPPAYWRGRPWIDWRAHYLWAPPYGYQWVYVDGDYVLIALATGLIADIVYANSYY